VAVLRRLLREAPGAMISVDLASQRVTGPDGQSDVFEIDSFRKDCLLKGVDEVSLTMTYEQDIARFEARQKEERDWL
jgi:3-isopropylmalate/(R)-2-methylmalate dehydratase small subunit